MNLPLNILNIHRIPVGESSSETKRFFEDFRSAMVHDFEWEITVDHLLKFRRPTTPLIAKSLAEILDRSLLRGMTFSELRERERAGSVPYLLVNSTILNNGRHLVMTNLTKNDFNWGGIENTFKKYLADKKLRNMSSYYIHRGFSKEIPMTLEDLNADKRGLPLSSAVAASASLPFHIGPVTLHISGSDERYWHLVYGGVFDNGGTESLFAFLVKKQNAKYLSSKKMPRALMIVVDTFYPFDSGTAKANSHSDGSEIMARDPARVFDIMEGRMVLYKELFWTAHINSDPRVVHFFADYWKVIRISRRCAGKS